MDHESNASVEHTEQTEPSRSRRGLITGAVGIAAAVVLSDAGSASAVGEVVLGQPNSTTTETTITNTSTGIATALIVHSDASSSGFGLKATGSSYGVYATGNKVGGVFGNTNSPDTVGVTGECRSKSGTGIGVGGLSSSRSGRGVSGESPGIGVYGIARSGSSQPITPTENIGVLGSAPEAGGIGGVFGGANAAVRLLPAGTTGSPKTGTHQVGEVSVSSDGNLYFCSVAGTPGTWVQLGATAPAPASAPRLVLLSTPERFVDTRAGLGGVTGPLPALGTTMFTMTGRNGESGNAALQIPDNASALVGNLTVLGSTPALGYLTVWPGGALPTVSNINFGPSAQTGAVANSFLVGLSPSGGQGTLKVFNSVPCDYLIDVTAYYV